MPGFTATSWHAATAHVKLPPHIIHEACMAGLSFSPHLHCYLGATGGFTDDLAYWMANIMGLVTITRGNSYFGGSFTLLRTLRPRSLTNSGRMRR